MSDLLAVDPSSLLARAILAFGALVVVPLGLFHATRCSPASLGPPLRAATLCTRIGAPLLVAALVVPAGAAAAVLVAAWGLATLVVARAALLGLLAHRGAPAVPGRLALHVGLGYLPVSAMWALVYRSNGSFAGFSGTKALLTAAHFQYAGFGACLLVGALGARRGARAGRAFRVAAVSTVLAVALVAAGIALSHVLEVVSAWLLLASVALVAVELGRTAREARPVARALLVVSAVSALVAAGFAAHFATFGFARLDDALLVHMLRFHGAVNALGFVTSGLVGLALLDAAPSVAPRPPRLVYHARP